MNAVVSLLGIATAVIILYGMQSAIQQRDSPAAQSNAMHDQPCPVRLGATADTIRRSGWGNPNHVNEHLTSNGTRQQWVYAGRRDESCQITDPQRETYLYFDNGFLV